MTDQTQTTALSIGQEWRPTKAGSRASARRITALERDREGHSAVRYAAKGGSSRMRVDGFKSWIRKMEAVLT